VNVDRAELLVAAGNAFLVGALTERQARRACALKFDRHAPELVTLLGGVDLLRVAGPERAAARREGAWRTLVPEAAFSAGKWRVTWRESDGEQPAAPPSVEVAAEVLGRELDEALAALPAAGREARILVTAGATLRGAPSPTASPIRRLRTRLGQGPPGAPRASVIAGGELPAAYPEPARRLFRAAIESERDTPAARAARAAALATLP